MHRLEQEIKAANEKTLQAALKSALENTSMFYKIELAATVAASAAAGIQHKQKEDLQAHVAALRERFRLANDLRVVKIVETPDLDSEQMVIKILTGMPAVADPVVTVILYQLEHQKEAARKNELELAKVLKWAEEAGYTSAPKQEPPGVKKGDVLKVENPMDHPPEKPTSVAWSDTRIDLPTKIKDFLSGIGLSNRDLVRDRCQEVETHLKNRETAAATAGAIAAVLRDMDEKLEAARSNTTELALVMEEEEEEESEETMNAAINSASDGANKGSTNVLANKPSASEGSKKESLNEVTAAKSASERRREEEARAKVAKQQQEEKAAAAKKRASITIRFPRSKLYQIDFHSVRTLLLYSFTEEQIARARENEKVHSAEQQVTAAHEKIAEGLEGIIEGCRQHLRKEHLANVAAQAAAVCQEERSSKLKQQVADMEGRIRQEAQDEVVLFLPLLWLQSVC